MEEIYRLWLAAVPSPIPEDEARIYWNCKADPTPVLDAGLCHASYLYVGSWRDEHEPENLHASQGRCPANRLHSWLFYLGTIERYQAPLLDEELMAQLIELHRPRSSDLPADAIDLQRLEGFLRQHLGLYLLPEGPESETYG
ncbi:hypothetical protein [Streptomyces minutiscleroticus]|uniref:Uncharacterized protein n=1 Tax=Streptomyces minutiscleroticus TaxID=68238 RepID=A0A918KQJ5_9ACTN|nr:hypothetical protein [Streptomyces minutiscleroticus]GGX69488.1 hypothetical protein GCM10010358_24970 [Streptomyces minutiscleroticus]